MFVAVSALLSRCSRQVSLQTECKNIEEISLDANNCTITLKPHTTNVSNANYCANLLVEGSITDTQFNQEIMMPNNIRNTVLNINIRLADPGVLRNMTELNLLKFNASDIHIDNLTVNYVLTDLNDNPNSLQRLDYNERSMLNEIQLGYNATNQAYNECTVTVREFPAGNSYAYDDIELNNSKICFEIENASEQHVSIFGDIINDKQFFNIIVSGVYASNNSFSIIAKFADGIVDVRNCYFEVRIRSSYYISMISESIQQITVSNTLVNISIDNSLIFGGLIGNTKASVSINTVYIEYAIEARKECSFVLSRSTSNVWIQMLTMEVNSLHSRQFSMVMFSRVLGMNDVEVIVNSKNRGAGSVVEYQAGTAFQRSVINIRSCTFVYQGDGRVPVVYNLRRNSVLEMQNVRMKNVKEVELGTGGVYIRDCEFE